MPVTTICRCERVLEEINYNCFITIMFQLSTYSDTRSVQGKHFVVSKGMIKYIGMHGTIILQNNYNYMFFSNHRGRLLQLHLNTNCWSLYMNPSATITLLRRTKLLLLYHDKGWNSAQGQPIHGWFLSHIHSCIPPLVLYYYANKIHPMLKWNIAGHVTLTHHNDHGLDVSTWLYNYCCAMSLLFLYQISREFIPPVLTCLYLVCCCDMNQLVSQPFLCQHCYNNKWILQLD